MPDGPLRLLLGSVAVRLGEQSVEARKKEIERFRALSESTDA